MTAKEALRGFVDDISEDEARDLLPLLSGAYWQDDPAAEPSMLSAGELLRLPAALRSMIIRHQVAGLSQEELDEYVTESEAWIHSDADALKHIDD